MKRRMAEMVFVWCCVCQHPVGKICQFFGSLNWHFGPLLHPWQRNGSGAIIHEEDGKSRQDGHDVNDYHYTSFV